MAVTAVDGAEWGLMEGEPRLAAFGGEGHRDQRFEGVFVFPGIGEHQALGRDDLAIDALGPVIRAFGRTDAGAPGAAGANVALDESRGEAARAQPMLKVLGL